MAIETISPIVIKKSKKACLTNVWRAALALSQALAAGHPEPVLLV